MSEWWSRLSPLRKEAAINDAKKSVAEKDRDDSIGEANAKRDECIQVSDSNAKAVEGENRRYYQWVYFGI
jgi:hypothetical protein